MMEDEELMIPAGNFEAHVAKKLIAKSEEKEIRFYIEADDTNISGMGSYTASYGGTFGLGAQLSFLLSPSPNFLT